MGPSPQKSREKKKIKCEHEWGTDGQHSNVFCKKCYMSQEEYEQTTGNIVEIN